MTPEAISMVDLEGRLQSDEDGTVRDQLVSEFTAEAETVKRHLDSGLAPDEFERSQRLYSALGTAAEVVTKYWEMSHPV